jgi:hypothetical protein
MTVIAYAGEKIKGRDGKVIATVATDIHSGDLNIRPNQFSMADGSEIVGFVPEEIMEFIRDKMSSPSEEPKAKSAAAPKPKKAAKKAEAKAPAKVEPAKNDDAPVPQAAPAKPIGQMGTLSGWNKR